MHRKGKKGRKPPVVKKSPSEKWFDEISLGDVSKSKPSHRGVSIQEI